MPFPEFRLMAAHYTLMDSEGQGIFAEKVSAMRDEDFRILPLSQEPMSTAEEKPLDALAAYVRKVMRENNLTVYAVERQARKRGGTLGKSTVDAIVQGTLKNPGIFTIRELAWGLSRPVEEVVSVALGTLTSDTAGFKKSDVANLWEGYTQLIKKSDQRVIERIFEMLDREIRRLLSSD